MFRTYWLEVLQNFVDGQSQGHIESSCSRLLWMGNFQNILPLVVLECRGWAISREYGLTLL